MWFSLSGGESNQNLAYAKEHMTSQQIFVAKRGVKDWKIRHHDQQDKAADLRNPQLTRASLILLTTLLLTF